MARQSSSDGTIMHYNAVTIRVNGVGSLKLKLYSSDEVRKSELVPLTMSVVNNRELTRIANFRDQRAQLEFRITSINEKFEISKIVIFSKPVATSYPG